MRLDDKLTNVSPLEMFSALKKAWKNKFNNDPKKESLVVILAQWALETGRGKFMHNYNCGNVKATSAWTGDYTYFACNEIINGKIVWFYPDDPGCKFRAFNSLDEGVASYLDILYGRFGGAWPAVISGNVSDFVHLLKKQRYFTANEESYRKTSQSLFDEFMSSIHDDETLQMPDVYTVIGQQTILKKLGFDPGDIDGILGPGTLAAIKHFQLAHGLVADGIVGQKTSTALLEEYKK